MYGFKQLILILAACTDFPDSLFLSLSLAIHIYHLSLPVGLLDHALCPYRAVIGKFFMVGQHLLSCLKGSIEKRLLWVCLYFSSSVPAYFVRLIWMVLGMGGRWQYGCWS